MTMLAARQTERLLDYFKDVKDPRRPQGLRHSLATVLALATAATLCGMDGYSAIAGWAKDQSQTVLERFACRYEILESEPDGKGGKTWVRAKSGRRSKRAKYAGIAGKVKKKRYIVPSLSAIRSVLTRVVPDEIDRALEKWRVACGLDDQGLAVDGKTMCNAKDKQGRQTHIMSVVGHETAFCHTQKKVGTIPVKGGDGVKQTNEIGMFTFLLDAIEIKGKDITVDALLTQRKIADYIVGRDAHYHFTVKENQPKLADAIAMAFAGRSAPDFEVVTPPDHGRIETRRIWCSANPVKDNDFPHVGQIFLIERDVVNKKTGVVTTEEVVLGVTSRTPEQASPERLLTLNRGHWTIENSCHYVIDWNFNEDRSRISTGHGPENVTRLRRFAVGVIKYFSDGKTTVAQKMTSLNRKPRIVLDYLRMTENSAQTKAH